MMKHGQKDLGTQIEKTLSCCDQKGCDDPLWNETQCGQCGAECTEKCSFYLGRLNTNHRENRWYDGKYPVRRVPKGDYTLPVEIGTYVALQDTPSTKKGDAWKARELLFLEIKHCRKEPLEVRSFAR